MTERDEPSFFSLLIDDLWGMVFRDDVDDERSLFTYDPSTIQTVGEGILGRQSDSFNSEIVEKTKPRTNDEWSGYRDLPPIDEYEYGTPTKTYQRSGSEKAMNTRSGRTKHGAENLIRADKRTRFVANSDEELSAPKHNYKPNESKRGSSGHEKHTSARHSHSTRSSSSISADAPYPMKSKSRRLHSSSEDKILPTKPQNRRSRSRSRSGSLNRIIEEPMDKVRECPIHGRSSREYQEYDDEEESHDWEHDRHEYSHRTHSRRLKNSDFVEESRDPPSHDSSLRRRMAKARKAKVHHVCHNCHHHVTTTPKFKKKNLLGLR